MEDKRLEAIKKNRACKRLPVDAPKEQRLEVHRIKMAAKRIYRNKLHEYFKADFERFKEQEKLENSS